MSTTRLWLRISTRSDWAIGTGKARYGALDSTVARDADGIPHIPASTLKGMLRDAAEQAAFALDGGTTGAWAGFVARLFGSQPVLDGQENRTDYDSPAGGLLRFGAAQLGVMDGRASLLRAHLCGHGAGAQRLRQALTFVKPGVAIDRMSGTAKTNMLRFDEVTRQGLTLVARIDLDSSGAAADSAVAFLQAACFLMDRVGSKRRRGLGQIEAVLLRDEQDIARADVEKLRKKASAGLARLDAPPVIASCADGMAPPSGAASTAADAVTLRASYMLLTPVLAATSVEGNVVLSADHLPGSMLLPAVKRALSSKTGKTLDDAIAAGRFSVSPALPMLDGKPGLVAPACFERLKTKPEKDGDDRLFNMLDNEAAQTLQQKKGMGGAYLCIDDKSPGPVKVTPFKVSRSLFTHNSIIDETQRPEAIIGGVYVYEALDLGTMFQGQVRLPKDIADSAVGPYDILVGRAKSAGYGAIRLTLEKEESVPPTVKRQTVRLYLASDAICHGVFGQPEAGAEALVTAIAAAAGVAPETVQIDESVLKAKTIQSWSVAACLPRPTIVATAAGSVAIVTFATTNDAQAFAKAVANGIGERCAEGFGQVLVDPPWLMEGAGLVVDEKKDKTQPPTTLPALKDDGPDYKTGIRVEEAAWRAYAVDAIEALVADDKMFERVFGFPCGSSEAPSPSQLGGLKSAIMAAGNYSKRDAIKTFLVRPVISGANANRPSADMEEKLGKLGKPAAAALWKIATQPTDTILPELVKVLPGPPACIVAASPREAFIEISEFAVSALILACIQMHGRKLAKAEPAKETA